MAYNSNYSQRSSDRVRYDIIERIGVLGERRDGWTREVNVVAWNGAQAKVDIRDWAPDHNRMTKGITLLEDEAENLVKALAARYGLRIGSSTMANSNMGADRRSNMRSEGRPQAEKAWEESRPSGSVDAFEHKDVNNSEPVLSNSGLYDDEDATDFSRSEEVAEDALDGDDEYE